MPTLVSNLNKNKTDAYNAISLTFFSRYFSASGKFVGELIFLIGTNATNLKIICGTDRIHIKPKKVKKWARKSIHPGVSLLDKEIPPSDLNNFVRNSAEPRF